jgi:peptidoglycan/xylan/chitin deacetylase (PgdA/CDA1 family)
MRAFLDRVRHWRPRSAPQPIILMYHRVAQPPVDPWGLSVRPDHFEEHLTVLRRSRRPLAMSEFVERLERRTLPGDAVAVTFDDGYVDNLREAKPRAEARGIPATVFVTSGAVGQRTEYWWDELARGILLHDAALDVEVVIAGDACHLVFPPAAAPGLSSCWRAWQAPRTEREATFLQIWRRLQTVSAAERDRAMQSLRALLHVPPAKADDLPMTEGEIAELAAGGLFEIGGHTVTHPVLPTLDAAERRREILQGKLVCERFAGGPIAGFAYPHGALDVDSHAAVQECGFAWACSTARRAVSGRDYDRYALPRISVADSNGRAFERALQAVSA